MAIKTQRPSVIIKTYKEARAITNEYIENDIYLRSLIRNHVPNAELILSCSDFANLKYHGRTILGVAKKIIRNSVDKKTQKSILDNISKLKVCTEISEREDLEERIAIQLEGCKVPDSHFLVKKYNQAKT